mgnify:CR=1 FL=1
MNTIAWDSVKREVAISSVNSAVAQIFCQLISLAVLNLNVIEVSSINSIYPLVSDSRTL